MFFLPKHGLPPTNKGIHWVKRPTLKHLFCKHGGWPTYDKAKTRRWPDLYYMHYLGRHPVFIDIVEHTCQTCGAIWVHRSIESITSSLVLFRPLDTLKGRVEIKYNQLLPDLLETYRVLLALESDNDLSSELD